MNAQNGIDNQLIIEKRSVGKQLELANFDAFDLQITKANVYLKPGNKQEVIVKGQPSILAQINTKVVDGEWIIALPKSVKKHKYLSIYITLPALKAIKLSSGGQITGTGEFYNTNELMVNLSSSGMIKLTGAAQKVYVKNTGVGMVDLSDFKVVDCSVRIEGTGTCKVHPKSLLSTNVFGGGKVIYRTGK